jgi:hypothetical protein
MSTFFRKIKFITVLNGFIMLFASHDQVMATASTSDDAGVEVTSCAARLNEALKSKDFRRAAVIAEKVLQIIQKQTPEHYSIIANFWNRFFDQDPEATAQEYHHASFANEQAGSFLKAAQFWDETIRALPMSKLNKKHLLSDN